MRGRAAIQYKLLVHIIAAADCYGPLTADEAALAVAELNIPTYQVADELHRMADDGLLWWDMKTRRWAPTKAAGQLLGPQ